MTSTSPDAPDRASIATERGDPVVDVAVAAEATAPSPMERLGGLRAGWSGAAGAAGAMVRGLRLPSPHRAGSTLARGVKAASTMRPGAVVDQTRRAVGALASTGVLRPIRPDRVPDVVDAVVRWGSNPVVAVALAAARDPDRPAVIDDLGPLTFRQLAVRSDALARSLAGEYGVGPGRVVGLLCRNHRGFVESALAVSKLGADLVLVNTDLAPGPLAQVCRDESVQLLVHDEEFTNAASGIPAVRVVAWTEGPQGSQGSQGSSRSSASMADLMRRAPVGPPPAPNGNGRVVILTSGTTGHPRGAVRSRTGGVGAALALLARIPFRGGETVAIAPPLFHAWGFGTMLSSLAMGDTVLLHRRFDPELSIRDIEAHRVAVMVAVPIMLQRMLECEATSAPGGAAPDTSSLRIVATSGAALGGNLAPSFMDRFGDVLYNLYGSTEVAWATVADPGQLRADPATAGTPPPGTRIAILDDGGRELPAGERGRIFVGNGLGFDGYTGGGGKAMVDGMVETGDTGRIDAAGRLVVEGRSDEMIVSGGENVFPAEVEDVLRRHPAVADVAVVGVPDERFGMRLAVFVVRRPGRRIGEETVRRMVRDRLARFKVPRDVVFVEAIPRNAAGKVLRRSLRVPEARADRPRPTNRADRTGRTEGTDRPDRTG